MKWPSPSVLVLAALSALLASCCSSRPGLRQIEEILSRELAPATMETKVRVVVGRPAVYLARLLGHGLDTDHDVGRYLSDVRRVEVAAYEITGLHASEATQASAAIARLLKREGWDVLVKASQAQDMVWVVYHADGEAIRDLYVVALDNAQLVLVKVDGRLDRIIAKALGDQELSVGDLTDAR